MRHPVRAPAIQDSGAGIAPVIGTRHVAAAVMRIERRQRHPTTEQTCGAGHAQRPDRTREMWCSVDHVAQRYGDPQTNPNPLE
ncbi:hypothetical protein GCM10007884_13090 [Methylobacterium brachythecii]|uniref:Uncharacterized protein n=1 Tax=Methylobacterium brachythecii TaxID=1176177 RepID=A0ABQ6D0H4_9HYPH|nr:hypothetical protein GCM10007884_13090 [Methylobacterium brachythecii]